MADIFLSYRNTPTRRAVVERLAAILEAYGLDVWWDYGLEAGSQFYEQIFAEIASAKVVTPLWCSESVKSEWVLMEAAAGKDKLVPIRLQEVQPPKDYQPLQAANLINWTGSIDRDDLTRFVETVAERAGVAPKKRMSLLLQMRQLPQLAALASETGSAPKRGVTRASERLVLPGHGQRSYVRKREAFGITLSEETRYEPNKIWTISFSSDGRRIVTSGQGYDARIWDSESGALVRVINPRHYIFAGAVFLPQHDLIASYSGVEHGGQRGIDIWDATTGAHIRTTFAPPDEGDEVKDPQSDWGAVYRSVAFSDDGKVVLAAGHTTYEPSVWDWETDESHVWFIAHETPVDCVRIGKGREFFLTSSDQVVIHDAEGDRYSKVSGSLGDISPDNKRVVTRERTLARVWSIDGTFQFDLEGHSRYVEDALFSPSGDTILTYCESGDAKVWNATNGALITTLAGEYARTTCCAYAPDGKSIAIARWGKVHIYALE